MAALTEDIQTHKVPTDILLIGTDANCNENSSHRRKNAWNTFLTESKGKCMPTNEMHSFHHSNGTSMTKLDYFIEDLNERDPVSISFFDQPCKNKIVNENLSGHDPIIAEITLPSKNITIQDENDYSNTYTEFIQKYLNGIKVIFRHTKNRQDKN